MNAKITTRRTALKKNTKANKALVYCWVDPEEKKRFKSRCAEQGKTMRQMLLSIIAPSETTQ